MVTLRPWGPCCCILHLIMGHTGSSCMETRFSMSMDFEKWCWPFILHQSISPSGLSSAQRSWVSCCLNNVGMFEFNMLFWLTVYWLWFNQVYQDVIISIIESCQFPIQGLRPQSEIKGEMWGLKPRFSMSLSESGNITTVNLNYT